jgi:hypothetical protein
MVHNVQWSIWNIQSQAQVGELSSETWQAQLAIVRRLLSTKGVRWFWANYGQEFGPSFRRIVAGILNESSGEDASLPSQD